METYIKLIERFIHHELKGDQLDWCKNQLHTNEDFAMQYRLQLDINSAIKEKDVIELRRKLKTIYQQHVSSGGKVIFGKFAKNLAAAASILIVLGISALYFLTNQTYTNQKIVQMHYKVYDNYYYDLLDKRSGENGGENLDDLFP